VKIGRVSITVLLSIFIVMFMTVIGCGKKEATSVISGAVNGDIVEGVTINMTGGATTSTTTDASGKFIFNNQDNGYFTITPYLDGYSFSPANADVVVNGVSITGIDFTSTWAGYGISGTVTTVTGDVAANVTLTAYNSGKTTSVTSATTDSKGKYALSNAVIGKTAFSFDVTPSLAGYKFTPKTRPVTINGASVTGIDFESIATHAAGTAKGTYTWDLAGNLVITWEAGTSTPCNWPKAGPENESLVTISKNIMTWPDAIHWPSVMIWTREISTENDPAGVWTATDQSGNTYTATVTATNSTSGSISLDEKIIACSYAWSTAWSTADYKVALSYQDPQHHAVPPVSVKGPGITGSLPLTYNGAGAWTAPDIDLLKPTPLPLPDPLPPPAPLSPPYVYTFTITDSGTTWEETSCFVDWPKNLYIDWIALGNNLTFHWDAISDTGASYVVQLIDSSYNLIWESDTTTGISTKYQDNKYNTAIQLTAGQTYYFYVQVRSTGSCSNGMSSSDKKSFIAPAF